MTIFCGSLSSLSDVEKTRAIHCRPVGPFQRRSAGPFPVVIGNPGPKSDRLPVNITFRLMTYFSLQSFFSLKISKFSRVARNTFLTWELSLINFSFFFQYFPLTFSLILSRLGVSDASILPCWQNLPLTGFFSSSVCNEIIAFQKKIFNTLLLTVKIRIFSGEGLSHPGSDSLSLPLVMLCTIRLKNGKEKSIRTSASAGHRHLDMMML